MAKMRPKDGQNEAQDGQEETQDGEDEPQDGQDGQDIQNMRRVLRTVPGAPSTHPERIIRISHRLESQVGPKMDPSWLQVEPRLQLTQLQKQAFRMGGVSKIKVAGNNWGTKETNFRAKITWFEETSETKEYRIETRRFKARKSNV